MDFKNGEVADAITRERIEVADAITRERMKLAGLQVPGEEPQAVREWKLAVNKENRIREMAGELLVAHSALTVKAAFEKAEEFASKAYARMEALHRQEPTSAS